MTPMETPIASEGDSSREQPVQYIANYRPMITITPVEQLTYDANNQQTVVSLQALFDDLSLQEMQDPIAYAASSNPAVMYLHEAKSQPDWEQFHQAMGLEVSQHTKKNNWEIVKRKDIPPEQNIFPSVWAMHRKRRLHTREVYKHKAQLNFHGGLQEHGVNFWETYSPIV